MKKILLILLLFALIATTVTWVRYGGGDTYPDLSSEPILDEAQLEQVIAYPEPIGSVAVSKSGRVFFTVHPESRPQGNRLLEYVDGAALPYPNVESQLTLFDTVSGIVIDRQNRLWSIDHGNHGLRSARLLAFDLETGELIHDQRFGAAIAPAGSLLQDLQLSVDGATVVIADTSFWRQHPAIIVYDVASGTARRVLEDDASVAAEKYLIRNAQREMSFLGGVISLRGGVDGIALGPEWLYYGAMTGSGLYRIRLSDLQDEALPVSQLSARVERYATKPLSGGFGLDTKGNVYVTDVEHSAITIVGQDRKAITLIQSKRIRWPDGLASGPADSIYVTDSALSELVLKPREHIRMQRPYRIFRFNAGDNTVPE